MGDKTIKRTALGEKNVHTVSKYHTYHVKLLIKNRGENYIFLPWRNLVGTIIKEVTKQHHQ